MLATIICHLLPREFTAIRQGTFQTFGVEFGVEYNCMDMRGHDDISVHTQAFGLDAEVQAVGNDFAGVFADEDRKPSYNCEGYEIDPYALDNSIVFQYRLPFRSRRIISCVDMGEIHI